MSRFWLSIRLFLFFLILFLMSMPENVHAAEKLSETDSLRNELSRQTVDSVRVKVLADLASLLRHSNPSEALVYAQEALKIVNTLNSPVNKASVLQILGLIYNAKADYQNSYFYSLQALRIYDTLNNAEGKAYAINALGLIYENLGKLDLAWDYYEKSLALLEKAGIYRKRTMIYCNLGNLLQTEHKILESIDYYKKALNNAILYKDTSSTYTLLLNIGETYSEVGQLDSARTYFMSVLNTTPKETGDYDFIVAHTYGKLGKLERKENHVDLALAYLIEAKKIAERGSIKSLQVSIYKELSELYKQKNDLDAGFKYYALYSDMKDSVFNETTVQQINEMQKTYEVEKRDKEIQLLSKDKEIERTKTRMLRIFFILFLVFLCIIGAVVIRNIILKKDIRNNLLVRQNILAEKDIAKLQQENTEARYEVLKSKTNPHFLFNSLNILTSIVMKDQHAAIEFIENFSELYRMILETGDKKLISLKREMKLVNNYLFLQQKRYARSLYIDIQVQDLENYFVPPFAVQMLVDNVIKHNAVSDEDNKLYVSIYMEERRIIVRNNLRKSDKMVVSTSIGQRNIMDRYALLCEYKPVFEETKTEYVASLPLLDKTEYASIYQKEA